MKKTLIAALLLCATALCHALNVVVRHTDGSEQTYAAADIEKVLWPGQGAVEIIFCDGRSVAVPAADFSELSFRGATLGAASLLEDESSIIVKDGTASVPLPLSAYSAAGVLAAYSADGRIDLGALPAGVYILSTSEESIKILVTAQ